MDTECDEDVYRMDCSKRGVFVIINNRYFQKTTGMGERNGTDVDAANLYQLFMGLGFDVRLEQNKTSMDMLRILDRGKGSLYSCYSCM